MKTLKHVLVVLLLGFTLSTHSFAVGEEDKTCNQASIENTVRRVHTYHAYEEGLTAFLHLWDISFGNNIKDTGKVPPPLFFVGSNLDNSYFLSGLEEHLDNPALYSESAEFLLQLTRYLDSGRFSHKDLETLGSIKDRLTQLVLNQIQNHTLGNLEKLIQQKQSEEDFRPNTAYAASFLAHSLVNLNAARRASLDAVWDPGNVALGTAWRAAGNAAENAALSAALDAAWNAALDAAGNAAWNAALNAAKDAAGESLSAHMNALQALPTPNAVGKVAYEIAELRVLLWLSEGMGEQYLSDAFNAAYDSLKGNGFLLTIDSVKEIILSPSNLKRPGIEKNPFSMSLMVILTRIEVLLSPAPRSLADVTE